MPRQAACKNPECRNGNTPGLVVIPKPRPQVGPPTMRWGWVPCPLCFPNPKVVFKPVKRSEDEIAARSDMATRHAPYVKPSEATPEFNLSRVAPAAEQQSQINGHASGFGQPAPPPAPAPDNSAIIGLSTALNNALNQLAAKDAEIARLRAELATVNAPLQFGSAVTGTEMPTDEVVGNDANS